MGQHSTASDAAWPVGDEATAIATAGSGQPAAATTVHPPAWCLVRACRAVPCPWCGVGLRGLWRGAGRVAECTRAPRTTETAITTLPQRVGLRQPSPSVLLSWSPVDMGGGSGHKNLGPVAGRPPSASAGSQVGVTDGSTEARKQGAAGGGRRQTPSAYTRRSGAPHWQRRCRPAAMWLL